MKYLFVTWDGGGNLSPELAVARRLVQRGHEVRVLGHRSQAAAVEDAGCGFTAYEQVPDCDQSRPGKALIKDWEPASPPKQFAKQRNQLLFGPAAGFAADVLAELDRYRPDAVAVDFLLFGGHAAAEKSGLPSAALWHTVYSLPTVAVPPLGPGLDLPKRWPGRLRDKVLRAMAAKLWSKGLPDLNAARAGIGLPPLSTVFDQFERLDRILVMSSRSFDFAAVAGAPLPDNVRYVGPQIDVGSHARGDATATNDAPLVLVSLSTTYQAQQPLLKRAVAALGTLPVRGLVTTGPAVDLDIPLPANVEVTSWAPHDQVLPEAALVITHAGHGTVMASLAHGVPMLCLPMGRDQNDIAARVVHAGAGQRLRPTADERAIATAIRDLLFDRATAANARRLSQAIHDEIAADRAVVELEALAHPTSDGSDHGAAPRSFPARDPAVDPGA